MARKVPPPKNPTGLYHARTFRGMSQDELAEKAGTTKGQISKLEKGALEKDGRKLTREWAERLAPVLNIPAERILFWDKNGIGPDSGDDLDDDAKVPVVGYVRAGAHAQYRPLHESILDRVAPPSGATSKTVAFEISGDSLGELFENWLVFFDDVRSPVTADLIGRLCVVGLSDGDVLVKKLLRGKKGLFTLLSNDSKHEPIENASVEWAARVKTMVPR